MREWTPTSDLPAGWKSFDVQLVNVTGRRCQIGRVKLKEGNCG
jgi:hypothetical protein